MKKITLIFSIILLSTTISIAQETTSYQTTLSKMIEVSGAQKTYKTIIGQLMTMLKQQKSEVPATVWVDFEEAFVKSASEDLLNILLPIYQKHLSEDDLKNMIVFYQTPTGKKFAEKTPLITEESMRAGQEWGKKIGEDFVKKLKEKGYE